MSFYAEFPFAGNGGSGVTIYPTFADFPAASTVPAGTLAIAADTGILYASNGSAWEEIGGPGVPLTIGSPANGLSLSSNTLSLGLSSTSTTGALSNTDWNTFNGKQAAGNYITALTGDGTASGPGSVALTLATVNSNVGSFSPAAVTVNGKGLVTAASNVTTGNLTDAGTDGITITGGTGAVLGSGTSISQHVADTSHNGYLASADWNTFNGKQASGNYATSGSGDVSWSAPSGAGPVTTSLVATSNSSLTTLSGLTAASSLASVGTITSGTWNATTIAYNHGGTGQSSSWNADGIVYASSTTALASTAVGTSGQVLTSNGSGNAPTMQTVPGNSTVLKAPTIQKFTSTGSTTGYLFTISTSTTCAVGDTYTNNGNTYTVLYALSAQSGQVLFTSGASAPTSSGTLSRSSGSGTSSITFSLATALATYTAPTGPGPLYLKIKLVGGGGGGGGAGTSAGTASTAGGNTFFGTLLLIGNGGGAGGGTTTTTNGGAGGSATINSPAVGFTAPGGGGGAGFSTNASNVSFLTGGSGGSSFIVGGGSGTGDSNQNGTSGTGYGGGGGGGSVNSSSSSDISGGGGGGGGGVEAIITSPSSTYVYCVGAAGSGATGSSFNGGAGVAGVVYVEEHYQ